jgi:hypothetical protein
MKDLRERVLVGLLVGMFLAGAAAAASQAATVLADVKSQGARAVASRLWSDSTQWNQIMTNIGHGSREWLQVAAALRPGTDAGASEALDEAMFLALKAAPVPVLQLLKDGTFETNTVCSSNIGIDYTPAQSRRFIKDRIKALETLSDTGTLATREQCLAGLRAALAEIDRSKAK